MFADYVDEDASILTGGLWLPHTRRQSRPEARRKGKRSAKRRARGYSTNVPTTRPLSFDPVTTTRPLRPPISCPASSLVRSSGWMVHLNVTVSQVPLTAAPARENALISSVIVPRHRAPTDGYGHGDVKGCRKREGEPKSVRSLLDGDSSTSYETVIRPLAFTPVE